MAFISTTDGTRLYWHEWDEGPPMLRGHGRSDQPNRGYDLDTCADDIATLIEDPWLARYWFTACELL